MATSKLQKRTENALSLYFSSYVFLENTRPTWLTTKDGARLELDFYCKDLSVAIEVQGKQHYSFVPYFHRDHDVFYRQLRRDRFKKDVCKKAGIALYEVSNNDDLEDVILEITITIHAETGIAKDELYSLEKQYIKKKTKGIRKQIKTTKRNMLGLSCNSGKYKKLNKQLNSLSNALNRVIDREIILFQEVAKYL